MILTKHTLVLLFFASLHTTMCGILGYIKLNESVQIPSELLARGLETLTQRGPDNKNHVENENCWLGHTRLSIIDTSQTAHQPMSDISGRYTLIFNGEIFNFKELRLELQNKGFQFSTSSDTEVLLKLLIIEGKSALNRLNGFFSFCFFDKLENKYLLGRDRFGVKPFVYAINENRLIFGSEIKALLKCNVDKTINYNALTNFFCYSYIPAPQSIFLAIKKLLPGHLITVENGQINIESYYHYYPTKQPFTGSYEEAKKKLNELLLDATHKRLISDVPIGSFLSGGIDSSIISLLASKATENLHTFSLGFKDEPIYDETKYAELVAKKIKSNHTTFSLTNDDLLQNFEQALNYFDEPFADSSALNMFILSKLTKQKVTVALSGDGADELFSGYNKHKALFAARQQSLSNLLIKNAGGIVNLLPQSRSTKIGNISRQLEKYRKGLQLSEPNRYLYWASFMDENLAMKLSNNGAFNSSEHLFFLKEPINQFTTYLYYDFNLVLPNDMLRKVDAMSMANALEVRTPFLDFRIVEFGFSLPDHYKIDKNNRKKILKDTFRNELPKEIYRRGKHGFEVPLYKWFTGELSDYLNTTVFNQSLIEDQGILNWNSVAHIKEQLYSSNPKDSVYNTWALLSFQHWYKRYICD
jgi:asparagine synthase (glutamine-hydrolysing)